MCVMCVLCVRVSLFCGYSKQTFQHTVQTQKRHEKHVKETIYERHRGLQTHKRDIETLERRKRDYI